MFLTSNSNNRLIEYDKSGPESHIVLLSCGNKGYCLLNRNAIDNFKYKINKNEMNFGTCSSRQMTSSC